MLHLKYLFNFETIYKRAQLLVCNKGLLAVRLDLVKNWSNQILHIKSFQIGPWILIASAIFLLPPPPTLDTGPL